MLFRSDGGTLTAGTRTVPLDAESVTVALDEDGDIAVRLASPPDGPLLLVERLVAETNGERWYLVGSPPRARGGSLLSRVVSATPVPALPPLTLPEPVQSTVRPDMFVVKAPTLDIPNDDVVYLRTGALCSPIAADRDGVPAATLKRPSGATWYFVTVSRKEVHIRAAEGAPPVVGATWTFGLDPARTCRRGGVWVYGGDRLDVTPRNRGGLPIGANRLDLAGAAFGAIGETRVTLRMGDAVLAAVTVPPNGWDGAGIQVPLTTPVDAWTELPTLHVEMDGSGYLLLTTADVIAPADEPGAR